MKKLLALIIAAAVVAACHAEQAKPKSGKAEVTVSVGRIQSDPTPPAKITLTVFYKQVTVLDTGGLVVSDTLSAQSLAVTLSKKLSDDIYAEIEAARLAVAPLPATPTP